MVACSCLAPPLLKGPKPWVTCQISWWLWESFCCQSMDFFGVETSIEQRNKYKLKVHNSQNEHCSYFSTKTVQGPRPKKERFGFFPFLQWKVAFSLMEDVNVFAHLVAPLQSRSDHYWVSEFPEVLIVVTDAPGKKTKADFCTYTQG